MEAIVGTFDPYRECEDRCNHDLAAGVLVEDLLSEDGPHPPMHLVAGIAPNPVALLAPSDAELPAAS